MKHKKIFRRSAVLCLLVEAIAKKSQNIKWSTKVDGKNVQHRLIRRVSMDQFYAILTGEEDAFYKMCMALPEVINSVVNEEGGVEVPHDTVIDELRKVASLYGDENGELSMARGSWRNQQKNGEGRCRQTEGLPHPLAWIGTARKK